MTTFDVEKESVARASMALASLGVSFALTGLVASSSKSDPPASSVGAPLPTIKEKPGDTPIPSVPVLTSPAPPANSMMEAVRLVRDILVKANSSSTLVVPSGLLVAALLTRSLGEFGMYRMISALDESIVKREGKVSYFRLLSKFLIWGVPVTAFAQLSGLITNLLANRLRSSLTSAVLARVALVNKNTESIDSEKLETLIGDASLLASGLVTNISDKLRRIFDLTFQVLTLAKRGGASAPLIMIFYLILVNRAMEKLKRERPQVAKKAADRENVLRRAIGRFCRHKDSVALWNGMDAEKATFARMTKAQEISRSERDFLDFLLGLTQGLATKVVGTCLGFALVARPYLSSRAPVMYQNQDGPLQYFWSGRLMYQMCSTVNQLLDESNGDATNRIVQTARKVHQMVCEGEAGSINKQAFKIRETSITLCDVTATAQTDNGLLFRDLSFEIFPGTTMLLQGPKGSGKSALLRIIMGTWPVAMGDVCRPLNGVCCVSQKPYIVLESSLREQIIYPDSLNTINNEKLVTAIETAKIGNLVGNQANHRSTSLTDSEQQRLMIARLIYHEPKFALLDDCFKGLDTEYVIDILRYLRARRTAIIIACQPTFAETIKGKFTFDMELSLSTKQPTRHELVIKDSRRSSEGI